MYRYRRENLVNDDDMAEAWEYLMTLVAAIDAGDVAATDIQRAYLVGAADTLDRLRGRGTG